jgi:hypothetical protein
VYGVYSTSDGGASVASWQTDTSGEYTPANTHYILMNGDTCMFGGNMEYVSHYLRLTRP